ncbi:sporulation protein [Lysobacter maris]|uniref:Sporulation protein n=3 Tax=Marilutibacter maris TaxID=1605891 RepID=A0A2U9T8Q3_9GAMM|nr:sporulation protein [Lysobacter maris]
MIGAIVLVALAVIFLPMLIKGPAPESGVTDVPLEAPEAPQGEFETRELPLVTPGDAPAGGVVGMESGDGAERLPTVDADVADAADAASDGTMMPAAVAGGDYAVNFGTYSSSRDADMVIVAVKGAQLPAYQETVTASDGRTLHRVRIGPFATQADAEAARVRATGVHSGVVARVVSLNADAATPAQSKPPAEPVAAAPTPEPPRQSAADPESAPAPRAPAATETKPAAPAAATVGFAVQLGAFSHAEEAGKLRDRARAAGFTAFIEQIRTDKGVLNRVRVGPVASRAEAEQLKAQVAARLGIAGIVRPHP